ncbi:glycosyltransferase [Microbispora bryophytorum]|uniref:glycosyltransferase family 2 protein n=1 Tax=Microbispora bryophytorum TaxID=1460882 RepID=UPI0033CA77D2
MTPSGAAPQARRAPDLIGTAAPEIGVGMPVYNGEPYLTGALASILGQRDADFELVIADNCSTDATEEICREAARNDPRVRYLRRERNVGVIANYNRIVHETRGEFFSFATADDEYRADRLALLSAALRDHPAASVAFSASEEIDEAGRRLGLWRSSAPTGASRPSHRLRAKLRDYDECLHLYGLIRRSAIARALPLAPVLAGDRVMIAELVLIGPFVLVDEPLLRHRNHPASDSQRYDVRAWRRREVPDEDHRFFLPNVEEGRALMRAVRNAPLTRGERLACYAAMWPWLRRNAVPMARNVAHVGIDLARGLRRRPAPDETVRS